MNVLDADKLLVSCANGWKLMTPKTIFGLFRRFYEGEYRNFNTIGTGIGLSLVKSLVSIHNVTIDVESNEAVGCGGSSCDIYSGPSHSLIIR